MRHMDAGHLISGSFTGQDRLVQNKDVFGYV
jgi:hypothetical protein